MCLYSVNVAAQRSIMTPPPTAQFEKIKIRHSVSSFKSTIKTVHTINWILGAIMQQAMSIKMTPNDYAACFRRENWKFYSFKHWMEMNLKLVSMDDSDVFIEIFNILLLGPIKKKYKYLFLCVLCLGISAKF